MSIEHVSKWCREFKDGRTDILDEQGSGRPSVSDKTIVKVEEATLKDQSITVQELCELIPDVSKTCINKILTDHLRYTKVCARWVPRMLMEDHKRQCIEAAREFFPPTKPRARNFRTLLSMGTRSGCITPPQKRNNNPVSGNIHSSSNKHLLLPK